MSDRGLVYAAIGARFVEEARLSARSVKAMHPDLPIMLFSDRPPPAGGPFDEMAALGPLRPIPHLDKLVAMQRSPFPESLFLDTDTYVCGDIGGLFDLLDSFDIAMSLERRYVDILPQGTGVPDSFCEFNQGVVLFRQSDRMRAMVQDALDWAEAEQERTGTPPDDQVAMRVALYRSDLRIATLPQEYNCRFHSFGCLNGAVRILHGRIPQRANDPERLARLARTLNKWPVPRVFVAGEVRVLGRMRIGSTQHFLARRQGRLFLPWRAIAAQLFNGSFRRLVRAVRAAARRRSSARPDASSTSGT